MVKNSKTLKLVVCMSLIVALAISALSLSVRATYENTHNNSGNQASDIVGIATTQVGYGEGYDGYTKYGDWYGLPYSDWCAMFVSWCANQANVGNDVFPSFALCSAGADWFINQGRFQYAGSGYAPQAGDLIFYSSYGNIYHVGLVTGSDGSNVYSIEGNYNEAVYNVSYPLSYGDILGYATPAYGTAAAAPTLTETKTPAPEPEPVVYEDDEDEIDEVEDVIVFDDEEDEETDSDVEEEVIVSEPEEDSETKEPSTDTSKDTTPAGLSGDVNGDGTVNSADALLIQRYLAGNLNEQEVEDFILINADADMSGEVDIADALLVLELSVAA